jgi:RND family efflux transporter MFP subunit
VSRRLAVVAARLLVVAAGAAFWLTRHAGEAGDEEASPTAAVTTAPVRLSEVSDVARAYGTVEGDPAASLTLAAPRAIIVQQVYVRAGETVGAGQALAEVSSSPDAEQAWRQAVTAEASARADFARVQRLYDQQLAANDQLAVAKKALADADATLDAERQRGGGHERQVLVASAPAIVTGVPASPGDRLAQDAPLVAMARQGRLIARLGFEPGTANLRAGEPATISPTAGGVSVETHILMVGRSTDAATKTIEVLAPLPAGGPPIGAGVEGEVTLDHHPGLTVPRGAVVFDETGDHVFVVDRGKARRVFVSVGSSHGGDVELKGPITSGQEVAVQGAYELQDGMAVKVVGQ